MYVSRVFFTSVIKRVFVSLPLAIYIKFLAYSHFTHLSKSRLRFVWSFFGNTLRGKKNTREKKTVCAFSLFWLSLSLSLAEKHTPPLRFERRHVVWVRFAKRGKGILKRPPKISFFAKSSFRERERESQRSNIVSFFFSSLGICTFCISLSRVRGKRRCARARFFFDFSASSDDDEKHSVNWDRNYLWKKQQCDKCSELLVFFLSSFYVVWLSLHLWKDTVRVLSSSFSSGQTKATTMSKNNASERKSWRIIRIYLIRTSWRNWTRTTWSFSTTSILKVERR